MVLSVTTAPGVPPSLIAPARDGLTSLLRQRHYDRVPLAAARYAYVVQSRTDERPHGVRYVLDVLPLGGRHETDERGRRMSVYPVPKTRLAEVPQNQNVVYRGMAWEEWQTVLSGCSIGSLGWLNIDQPGFTFFGDAGVAEDYAGAFAPAVHRPAAHRPGVVVAVPRSHVLAHADRPDVIPVDEYAARGSTPANAIVGVWFLVPREILWGRLEIVVEHGRDLIEDTSRVRESASRAPQIRYVVVPGDVAGLRARCGG